MKLVCSQSDLSQTLAAVSRAVASRPTHPILANVLLEADPAANTLSITAFDLNLGICSTCAVQVEEGGRTTLPARLLNDIVTRLPNAELTFEQDDPEQAATLSCLAGTFQVRGTSPDDFPALPEVEGDVVELPVEGLLQGIGATLFAASADETKQVLTGVHVKAIATGLEFAATDGHRLATVLVEDEAETAETPGGDADLEFTIPARALREVERVLSNRADTTLKLQFDRAQMVAELPQCTISSRLLDGQYPNYRQLIPTQFERVVTVERKALMAALERAAVFAEQKNNILKFALSTSEQTLSISAEAPDVGGGNEALPVQYSGEDLEIAFNVKYLLDALKVIDAADVRLSLNGQTQPAVLEPLSDLPLRYLIMPVQLRSA
ncbi:MAG: DNA polymerase III subunit beta [Cyanobacteria bacterium J06648_11]